MDDIVRQALAKWPDVPACYGWLGLDARGRWRMRDERAQQLGLAGDKIEHTALLGFIARNYDHDERSCWFFQNGPQRVYVNLETTPFVARSDGHGGFVLHTGAPLETIDAAFLSTTGTLILQHGDIVAQLDDRDMAEVLGRMLLDGEPVGDEALMDWLESEADGDDNGDGDGKQSGDLRLLHGSGSVTLERIAEEGIDRRFGFCRRPAAPAAKSA
jgi:hypothetical protein